MATIALEHLNKIFPDGTHAVQDINLTVEDHELLVLVGPSGCGKSTLLRLVAGLEELTSGEIRIGDRTVNTLPPQERDVAMVFQNYALYPHMTVRKNLAFPLKMMKHSKAEIERRVQETAAMLGLEQLLNRKPKQLSGGQRQRVAMGRALVREPSVFLMDEPLSNLDAKLRVQMRTEITSLQRRLGTTTLYVTHDQVEAMTMGDRLAVLHQGRLQQVGQPQQLYDQPANTFVATFIGSPSMNLFRSPLLPSDSSRFTFRFAHGQFPLPPELVERVPNIQKYVHQEIIVGLRPEAFVLPEAAPESQRIEATIESFELMGHEQLIYFRADVERPDIPQAGQVPAPTHSGENGSTDESGRNLLVARLGPHGHFTAGKKATLGIQTNRVYLFNLQGQSLV